MECPEAVEWGRHFHLLTEEELPKVLDFLTGHLPESLKFQQTLLTYMRDKYESVGVFCPSDRLETLCLLRNEDILIDWAKPLYINFVHHAIAEKLIELYEGTGSVERVLGDVWACEGPENTAQIDEDTSDSEPDVQVLPLKPEHAEGIHELYPANDMECHELFLRLIKSLPAAGVFANGSLAAWMIQSYYGAMFSMQTRPEYRRKGYGTRLARYLTKAVAERGYNPFVIIRPENDASQSLYTKLGFRKLYRTIRATFTPYGWKEPDNEGDNLERAVRRLKVEQRAIEAFQIDEEATVMPENDDLDGDETIRDPSESPKDEDETRQSDNIAENGYERDDETLEPIQEQPEDRIESPDKVSPGGETTLPSDDKRINEEPEEAPQVEDSNEGDGGTSGTPQQDD